LAGPGARKADLTVPRLRLDKWLWQARFFKSRSLAADLVSGGGCRVNGQKITRAGVSVTVGDVLTFVQADTVRVVRVTALGHRRGPASEAVALYLDLSAGQSAQGVTSSPLE
jgi:ribosome-associated heat shock protein Hsp15